MKPFVLGKHDWDKGKVTRRVYQRSYEVQSHGTTYRCNRQHLVKSRPLHTQHETAKQTVPEPLPQAKQTVPDPLPQAQQSHDAGLLTTQAINSQTGHLEAKQSSPVRTRLGRVIKEPVRLQDYDKT